MVHKYFEGKSPAEWDPGSLQDPAAREALDALVEVDGDRRRRGAAARIKNCGSTRRSTPRGQPVVRANELIERVKPWAVAKEPERRAELGTALAALLETLRLVAIWSWPAIPPKCEELWELLALPGKPGEDAWTAAAPRFGEASFAGRKLGEVKSLFPRIELQAK